MLRYEGQRAEVDRFYTSNVYLYANIILPSPTYFSSVIDTNKCISIISDKKEKIIKI